MCDLKQFQPDHSPSLDCSNYCGTNQQECTGSSLGDATCADVSCSGGGIPTCTETCVVDYSPCKKGPDEISFDLVVHTGSKGFSTEWKITNGDTLVLDNTNDNNGGDDYYDDDDDYYLGTVDDDKWDRGNSFYLNHVSMNENHCLPRECYKFEISTNGTNNVNADTDVIDYLLMVDGEVIGSTDTSKPGKKKHHLGTCTAAPQPPTLKPSTKPSAMPSATAFPSLLPSVTSSPSFKPSILPTLFPSQSSNPSSSFNPTLFPSETLSSHPTQKPSNLRSLPPSLSAYPTIVSANVFVNFMHINPPAIESVSFHDTIAAPISIDVFDSHIVVGNPNVDSNTGAAYLFEVSGSYQLTLLAYDRDDDDWFGYSVSIYNDLIAIGSPGKFRMNRMGKVYVYHISGDFFAKLKPPASLENDAFGLSVAISNLHIIVGSPLNEGGKAYIFTTQLKPILAPIEITRKDLGMSDRFGWSISLSNEIMVIGARGQDNDRGAVFIYKVSGVFIAKLTAEDGVEQDWFGDSVSIHRHKIVVGAHLHARKGAAYMFDTLGNSGKVLELGNSEDFGKFGKFVVMTDGYVAVRTKGSVLIYNTLGEMLASRNVPGLGGIAMTDDILICFDDMNESITVMKHRDSA